MHVLLVAPSAPPKNSPEAMQVGRFLSSLDPSVKVTLVTTPIVAGWQWEDRSLAVDRPRMNVVELSLPAHRSTQRLLANRRLSFLHNPDSDFWVRWFAGHVLQRLSDTPDVIYSRSGPFSAALLARRLKMMSGKPWLMHLSDPWSDSPYRQLSPRRAAVDRFQEEACFAFADMITLTTEGQADHYRERYPDRAGSIFVTPNMMPVVQPLQTASRPEGPLRLVYTGALYGERDPRALLSALRILHDAEPSGKERIRLDFYGNMAPEMAALINGYPGCVAHGPIPFEEVADVQAKADVLVTVEAGGDNPLLLHFMPSKNLDYIAIGKPILAVTPKGSQTDRLCRAGYGWSFSPDDSPAIAEKLSQLARDFVAGNRIEQCPNLRASPFRALTVTDGIKQKLQGLVAKHDVKGCEL
ncbi:glycosyltransferase [Marinobacter adhaerens]|uniref:Glycosyltransferase subfamily 4-like N-terminal domain-containing protein n=2 Tax=Marinobacter adhaerens TaxID=1033846 RepID=E4PS16_MARAH|nr:conserved hypothetical protein [Marinobacter adhaerens HP15]MBW4980240.1 glycosyltransferase [Marinobacter adhaerens]